MTHPQTQDDEALVEARNRAKTIRNRVMVHMALTGETQDPNWREEAAIRAMLEYAASLASEVQRLGDIARKTLEEAFKAGLQYAEDEGWAHMPDELEQAVLAGNAALTALRNHEGRK